jgi:predicted nucleotidyltransferase component of viral defense system
MPRLAEKDMLECLMLEKLFTDQYLIENFVFSGGASISKSYNLTQRSCADIDLTCRDFQELNEPSKSRLKKFRADFKNFVFDVVKPKVNFIINQNQQFMIVTDRDWKALSDAGKRYSSPTLHVFYKSMFSVGAEHLSIEIIPRRYSDEIVKYRRVIPYSTRQEIGNIPTVALEQTFWDKISALHYNATADKPRCASHYSRHYYDVAKICEHVDLNATKDMFADTILYQQKYTSKKINWAKSVQEINLIPNKNILARLGQDYISLSELFPDTPESWNFIVCVLEQLQQKMRTVHNY